METHFDADAFLLGARVNVRNPSSVHHCSSAWSKSVPLSAVQFVVGIST